MAKPAQEAARLKPVETALIPALQRLEKLEGVAFEKLIRTLHAEKSGKRKGDFELSEIRLGYWNRPRDAANAIDIDLVALDEPSRRIRFGSCSERHPLMTMLQLKNSKGMWQRSCTRAITDIWRNGIPRKCCFPRSSVAFSAQH